MLAVATSWLGPVRTYHEEREKLSRRGNVERRARVEKRVQKRKMKKAAKLKKPNGTVICPASVSVRCLRYSSEDQGEVASAPPESRKRKRDEDNDLEHEEAALPIAELEDGEERTQKKRRLETTEVTDLPIEPSPPLAKPEILNHVLFGINEITKRLESQSAALRSSSPLPSPPIRLVLVCRPDMDSKHMVAHFPTLVAACNSARPPIPESTDQAPAERPPDLLLVALPRGAEETLSTAAGLRRCAAVAFDVCSLVSSIVLEHLVDTGLPDSLQHRSLKAGSSR